MWKIQVLGWKRLAIEVVAAIFLATGGCGREPNSVSRPPTDLAPVRAAPVGTTSREPAAIETAPTETPPADTAPTSTSGAAQSEPTIADDVVFRPTFATDHGEVAAGTAFAIQLPGYDEAIMLTALHLFGPAGGLEKDIPSERLGGAVRSISLEGCFNPERKAAFKARTLMIEDSKPHPERSPAGDIAAFWIPSETPIHALKLAPTPPAVGERVFLAAQVLIGASEEQRIHPATVFDVDHSKMGFVYEFDNPDIHIVATSGAPVLNQKGEVVAINLGGGKHENRSFGFGNPVTAFHLFLQTAAVLAE